MFTLLWPTREAAMARRERFSEANVSAFGQRRLAAHRWREWTPRDTKVAPIDRRVMGWTAGSYGGS